MNQSSGPAGAPVVLVTHEGDVRVLTLNRPHRRNAIDLELRDVLGDAIADAMASAGVRAVIVAGAGGTFCSGGDVTTMTGQGHQQTRERIALAQRLTRLLRTGPKPVVAAVEGAAHGAGLALALACDRVVAGGGARFNTAFTRVGLAGDLGITFTLPERVGPARARQLLLLAPDVSAEEARAMGLVDVLTDAGSALERALADAQQLAAGPPLALAAIKRNLDAGGSLEDALAREAETQLALFASADLAEGVAAFAQRRPPRFTGG